MIGYDVTRLNSAVLYRLIMETLVNTAIGDYRSKSNPRRALRQDMAINSIMALS